ncbi:hypothetical protein CcaverHIS002_0205610 [Cutaneotrichosporon cavernicola]|nr:hypothetical protein CcaverHIS002_0205610 [Cutaneotrichosporon cavernicola]
MLDVNVSSGWSLDPAALSVLPPIHNPLRIYEMAISASMPYTPERATAAYVPCQYPSLRFVDTSGSVNAKSGSVNAKSGSVNAKSGSVNAKPPINSVEPALQLCALLQQSAPSAGGYPVRIRPISTNADAAPHLTHNLPSLTRNYAQPAGSTRDANAAKTAELRDEIVSEIEALASKLSALGPEQASTPGWLLPLTRVETDFVNMGQVPCPEGCEVLALLDLSTGPKGIEHPGVGPDGKGVHVPLFALVGSTDPTVPCYPVGNLFRDTAEGVMGKIRVAVDAQRQSGPETIARGLTDAGRDKDAELVALLVPPDGKRDLGLPLALALFRLAMAEGNGYTG